MKFNNVQDKVFSDIKPSWILIVLLALASGIVIAVMLEGSIRLIGIVIKLIIKYIIYIIVVIIILLLLKRFLSRSKYKIQDVRIVR